MVEERRWATVLFADLSGFTTLSERTDPEDLRAILDRCLGRMGEAVERGGGRVTRLIGDEVVAVFGAPVAHGNDAERAVSVALEIQRYPSEWPEEFCGLSVRVGVNTGEVMLGAVGPESHREHTIYGDVVNTAKRLQTTAPIGATLVGEETWQATRRAIRYEELSPLQVKGKAEPVRAWRAVEVARELAPRSAAAVPQEGRDQELALLQGLWNQVVREGRAHLVTVLGPPGIGKTRLGRELASMVDRQGGRTLLGRSLPNGGGSGYRAFTRQVAQLAGIFDTDPMPTAREKLHQSVLALLPAEEVGELVASLALLAGVGLGPEESPADRQALFFAARRLVEALGQDRPTLLVFEDLHWADPSLLDLVEYLAGRVHHSPVMFLALARRELLDARPGWGGGLSASLTLPLDPLSAEASRALAERLLPPGAGPEAAERVAEAAADVGG